MSETANRIVQKLWSYCNVLRDDGLSYQDYLEQLTFLLFLKMADERAQLTGEEQPIPAGWRWADLSAPQMEGVELEQHYRETLSELGKEGGMLGLIFEKAQNKIQDPAKLRQLIVELIGKENWSAMSADVKGDAYEGLLERNAQDVKGGAGQYFTPRSIIDAIVDCVQPQPGEVVADPACGTGGFLLAAHEYLKSRFELDRDQKRHLRFEALRGVELVPNVARLCGMNLFLHGIGPDGTDGHEPPIEIDDALRDEPSLHADVVVTNPPFGKKSSITVVNDEGEADRQTRHLQPPGLLDHHLEQAAELCPAREIAAQGPRPRGHRCTRQRALRGRGRRDRAAQAPARSARSTPYSGCPTGIFYAQGVKANVLFFDRKPGSEETLDEAPCGSTTCAPTSTSPSRPSEWPAPTSTSSWSATAPATATTASRRGRRTPRRVAGGPYTYEEILGRDKVSLDLFWLRDESLEDSANLPDPHLLAQEIADDLRSALAQIEDVLGDLEQRAAADSRIG